MQQLTRIAACLASLALLACGGLDLSGPHCVSDEECPRARSCYRGFCVQDEAPADAGLGDRRAEDASSDTSDDANEPSSAVPRGDASTPKESEPASDATDASTQEEPQPTSEPTDSVVSNPAPAPDAATGARDAGSAAPDAGKPDKDGDKPRKPGKGHGKDD